MAGAAKRCVTPPTWVPYLTSSGNGTCAPFEGVHDDLYARALVLDDGCASVAILAVDCGRLRQCDSGARAEFHR